jgi:hypothetical protein
MLTKKEIQLLADIENKVKSPDHRTYYRAWRELLHLYEDAAAARACRRDSGQPSAELAKLGEMAHRAFGVLGGVAEPVSVSMKDYDHQRYGPFLGVSDEGRVAARIRDAFLHSPKVAAHRKPAPLTVGCSVDAERLGGAGEVPVGLDEYRDIQLASIGRVLTTTNVGTRVNARYFNDPPSMTMGTADKAKAVRSALDRARDLLGPYWHTPDGKPRPATLFVCFRASVEAATQSAVLRALREEMLRGTLCDPQAHTLGLLVRAPHGDEGPEAVRRALTIAARAATGTVAVDGRMRREAQDRISLPGLLNFFDKNTANKLWAEAHQKQIALRPWKAVDVDSVARTTWTSLQTARNAGLHLGKYGLLPLTVGEADYVIGKIQAWFDNWTAAPAIYIDCPTVAQHRCYDEEAVEAVGVWLDVAHQHGVAVALIDTADKSKGRSLLKESPRDEQGILSLAEIRELNEHARTLGIKALWAGGISAAQAYRFGEMGVFGIYTTSSTARKVAVSGDYEHDPSMPNEKEPTYQGVCRMALLLQAGFVRGRLEQLGDRAAAGQVACLAEALIERAAKPSDDGEAPQELARSLQEHWRRLLQET